MKKIGIIGVGKLGLCYALTFERAGCEVWASSYKQDYIESLSQKTTDSVEPGVADMLAESKNIIFTLDNHAVIRNCDVIYVMVATPSLPDGNYDVTAVGQVVQDMLDHPDSVQDKILVVGSTVNPGDCEQFLAQLKHRDVHVVYCPTFAAQGTVLHDIQNPIAISLGTVRTDVAERVRDAFTAILPDNTPVHQLLPTTAEILKLAGNCYGTLRINFYNTIGRILLTAGLEQDLEKANQYLGAVDRRKGGLRFGFGYGGPCYPRDNKSFKHYTNSIGVPNPLTGINDEINHAHADFLTDWLIQNNTDRKPYYFEYISYKPGVKIFEESHQLMVCERLLKAGYQVILCPSQFLDYDLVESLQQRFPEQVCVKSHHNLTETSTDFYPVNF
jgi:nucleotide sugar dehydrogenase